MADVVVVGGGIGGLSLARELSLRGLRATVLERNGLAEAVRADSWPYLCRETCDERGRVLALRDYRPLYDAGTLARGALVHRAHLLDVLLRSVPENSVRFGVVVADIDVTAGRAATSRRRSPTWSGCSIMENEPN